MRESDTYLAIVDEGREEQVKEDILVVGEHRLGAADEAVRSGLAELHDLQRLQRMIRRAFEAASWQELLDTP